MTTNRSTSSQKAEVKENAAATVELKPDTGLVGGSIRSLRKSHDMTLEGLSAATGLSIGYLSQVERDLSSPTLKALFDISRALGVSVGWFFNNDYENSEQQKKYIVRSDERREISYAAGIHDFLLNTDSVKNLEVLLSTFEPGASVMEGYSHEGEECGLVISGQLELWIDEDVFLLNQNDSFSFPSAKVHRYRNPGHTKTAVIWCVTPPTY